MSLTFYGLCSGSFGRDKIPAVAAPSLWLISFPGELLPPLLVGDRGANLRRTVESAAFNSTEIWGPSIN
jgi:hypothetical protein